MPVAARHWASSSGLASSLPQGDTAVMPAGQLSTPFQTAQKETVHREADPVQKAVNSGMGFIVGDILAQRLTGEAFDAVRSLELGLYGTLLGMQSSAVERDAICTACRCMASGAIHN